MPYKDPLKQKEYFRLRHSHQRPYVRRYRRRWMKNNPVKYMLRGAKYRAKVQGLPFSVTEQDIRMPKRCPVLGIRLVFGKGRCQAQSPSLDRIIPAKGYVRGNVRVISHRANTIKNDATLRELRAVLRYMEAECS